MQFYIELFYAIPSLFLYILVIIVILKDRSSYSGSFYTIFLVSSFINIACFINTLFAIRLPENTCSKCWLKDFFEKPMIPYFMISLFSCLMYHFAYSQFFIIFMISFNRFTAISWPTKHEKIWRRLLLPLSVFCIVAPFGSTWSLLISYTYYSYNPSTDDHVILTEAGMHKLYVVITLVIVEVILVLLTLLLNVVSIVRMRAMQNIAGVERTLFKISFIYFIVQVIGAYVTVMNLLFALQPTNTWLRSVFYYAVPYTSDLLTLSNPLILLIMNRGIREKVVNLFGLSTLPSNQLFTPSRSASVPHRP